MSKVEINPTEVAQLRRDGATWKQVREATGSKLISTRFAALLEEAGYDRAGIKHGSKQESKAIVKASANGNGKRGSRRGSKRATTKVDKSKTDADAKAAREKRARRAGKAKAKA